MLDTVEKLTVVIQQRLFDAYAVEVKRVSGNDDGIVTAAQGDIDTATDGFQDNERLYLPPTVFNGFAMDEGNK
jgi:hypothetical protein